MNPQMDAVQERAQRQLGALEDVHGQLARLRATGLGDGGRVRVEVDGNGTLLELELLPGAGGGKGPRLAEEIVGAAVRAATDVFARRAQIMQEFCGEFEALTDVAGTEPVDLVRPVP
ncbi:YbaB/EbfC family nucleoid-associated protein [Gordonia sp. (in: high G+C Gram-positive bacteria)]|uniref:YbaB/EbfC family nucleoid-associated protein n=1 Tax=Gordonia sp. (in: high G+C Gram-positive bacteria) TaxID=84139 RepID=UPI0016AD0DBB|nr:YbaB/EbfC family nucleoid-associated protein [Gordonia sp. (in: high G+C Gram-positive bacteria)]NLG45469.1 YbaB/EbfC family nucleoid-associated protein [Gordonia sp. (in: high G+C Gram-positive bacteria)]